MQPVARCVAEQCVVLEALTSLLWAGQHDRGQGELTTEEWGTFFIPRCRVNGVALTKGEIDKLVADDVVAPDASFARVSGPDL